MKKVGKIFFLSFMFGLFLTFNTILVKADTGAEKNAVTELNQIMTMSVDYDAKERPEETAGSVISYKAGSSVWVIGETQDGWYEVSYQNLKGYIPVDCVTELQVEVEEKGAVGLEEAGLDEEMEALEIENEVVIEEIERQRGEQRRSYIWIVVIAILVVGIFATGMIATIKSGKDKKKSKDNKKIGANDVEIFDLDSEEEQK